MARLAVAETFLDALTGLDPADVRRVARFLDKLVRAPEAASLRPEIVHDAGDRSVRSLKVTHDLRAIVRVDADVLPLLFVARHDRAYAWARNHCAGCNGSVADYLTDSNDTGQSGFRICSTSSELCRILADRGIEHGLTT